MLRRSPMKRSAGTRWPDGVFAEAVRLHGGCLGPQVGMPEPCYGALEPDHIRASGGVGMKSRSTLDNCAPLCSAHHRMKTNAGRTWRPKLIEAVALALVRDCGHVDPAPWCDTCIGRMFR